MVFKDPSQSNYSMILCSYKIVRAQRPFSTPPAKPPSLPAWSAPEDRSSPSQASLHWG